MPDKPSNPYQGLDKALLRSTRELAPASPTPPAVTAEPVEPAALTSERTDRSTRARTHASTDAPKRAGRSALTEPDIIKTLYRKWQSKQHLTQSTFRYRAEDLERLDQLYKDDLSKKYPRLSKNDLPRLALDLLLEDYEEHGEESVLAQVLERM
jgi:hypothetical protein